MIVKNAITIIGREIDKVKEEVENVVPERAAYLRGLLEGYKKAFDILDGKDLAVHMTESPHTKG